MMIDITALQTFRAQLEDEKRILLELQESGKAAVAPVELDQASVGRLSRMDAMQGQAMAQASHRRREARLRHITAALRRMETGDYGRCLECDEPIAEGRLRFDPSVVLCVRCAEHLVSPGH